MTTPKIFIVKINGRPPWEIKECKSMYVLEYNKTDNSYQSCDFDLGADRYTLSEASFIASMLNKINLNYTEITIPKLYGETNKQSKINDLCDL